MTRRALPGPMVDLIRDGVPQAGLNDGADRSVWRALRSTAMSAMQRGWTEPEWVGLLADEASRLGRQSRLRHGRKPRPPADHRKQLHTAWTSGAKRVATDPALTAEEITATITAVELFTADPDVDLPTAERDVLAVACQLARRYRTTRPALPRRAVQQATGLPERTIRTALTRLEDYGLLELAVRGRGGASEGRRRAHLYRLPDTVALTAYQYRGTRSMGRHVQVYGTSQPDPAGTPVQVYGTPDTGEDNMPADTTIVTLTVTGRPEELARAVRLLVAQDVGVVAAPAEPAQPNGRRLHAVASVAVDPHDELAGLHVLGGAS